MHPSEKVTVFGTFGKDALQWRCFQNYSSIDLWVTQRRVGEITSRRWTENASDFLWRSWKTWLWSRRSGDINKLIPNHLEKRLKMFLGEKTDFRLLFSENLWSKHTNCEIVGCCELWNLHQHLQKSKSFWIFLGSEMMTQHTRVHLSLIN